MLVNFFRCKITELSLNINNGLIFCQSDILKILYVRELDSYVWILKLSVFCDSSRVSWLLSVIIWCGNVFVGIIKFVSIGMCFLFLRILLYLISFVYLVFYGWNRKFSVYLMHNYYEKCIGKKRLDILVETTKHFFKTFRRFLGRNQIFWSKRIVKFLNGFNYWMRVICYLVKYV